MKLHIKYQKGILAMGFDLKTADRVSESILDSIKRFPISSILSFIITIITISILELKHLQLPTDTYIALVVKKIAFVSSLGIFLFPALRFLFSNLAVNVIGISILAIYYLTLPLDIIRSELITRHILYITSIFLMLFWTPFIFIKISNRNIWEWIQHLIVSFIISIFYSILLTIGLYLALYTVDRLFNISIPSIRYTQVAIIIFGIYGINLFLSYIPKYIILLQTKKYTKGEEIFTKYILSTLTVGYFIIIFIYDINILISMELPNNSITWISIIFSTTAILTYLFWTPLIKKNNRKFTILIWSSILLQTIILGFAITTRINQYGFTENRYFVAIFGIWLFVMGIYFIIKREASYKWLFVSITILLISSQFGKYSAIELSKRDQIERLQNLLQDINSSNIDRQKDIYSVIKYLYKRDKFNSLQKTIPDIVEKYKKSNYKDNIYFPDFTIKELGLKILDNKNRYIYFIAVSPRRVLNIKGYRWLVDFRYTKDYNKRVQIKDTSITYQKNILIIKSGKNITKVNLKSIIEQLEVNKLENRVLVSNKKLEYRTKSIKILFDKIGIDINKGEVVDFVAKILF